jgi:DNA-binding NtrC family response regulator
VDHFNKRDCERKQSEPKRMSAKGLKFLLDYPWPGNVRELENVIERAVLLSQGPEIDPKSFFLEQTAGEKPLDALPQATKAAREKVEREKITEAMQRARGNRSQAAKLLGISRAALYNKLKRHHLRNESAISDQRSARRQ